MDSGNPANRFEIVQPDDPYPMKSPKTTKLLARLYVWRRPERESRVDSRVVTPGDDLEALLADLAVHGVKVIRDEGALAELRESLCVVPWRDLSHQFWGRHLASQQRPAVAIVVTDEAETAAAAELIRGEDDLVHVREPAAFILWRLRHAQARNAEVRQFGDLALRDNLTGVLNRRSFEKSVADFSERCEGAFVSGLLFVDLDNFKYLNDCLGHVIGDEALARAARYMQARLLPHEMIFRTGGDEFAMLLARPTRDELISSARDLVEAFDTSSLAMPELDAVAKKHGPDCVVGMSGGLVVLTAGRGFKEVMREADEAMYAAKQRGRRRVVVAEEFRDELSQQGRNHKVEHLENVATVITERVAHMITNMARNLVDEATREAHQDVLTGLKNRRYMEEHLERDFESAVRHSRPLSVIFLDIDHFHDINTQYGWPSGDSVLRAFGACLEASVRAVDWCARYGGEEFVVVLPDTRVEGAAQIAERIRANTEGLSVESTDGRSIPVTVSLGVGQLGQESTPRELIDKVSGATKQAKASGRNRAVTASN